MPDATPSAADLITFLRSVPPELLPRSYQRIFTPLATLFCLLGQRLRGWSRQQALAQVHLGGTDALFPRRRQRPSQKIISHNTSGLSQACQRLKLDFLSRLLRWQAGSAAASRSSQYWNKHIRLLDGTTVTLRPFGNVPQQLPPHSNAKKKGYWCLLRVVVSFCLETGLATQCALGSKYDSEQALTAQLLQEPQAGALYLGDSNFGVLRVVQAIRASQADALLRLTEVRARKLLGRSPAAGVDQAVTWTPSAKDQHVQPHAVPGRVICVRLHRKGFRPFTLCLFTTLTDPATYPVAQLVELYGWRWQVEINLRHLKSQLRLERLETHSALMTKKEWLAGLIAYNFIRSVMRQAAQLQKPAAWISFSLTLALLNSQSTPRSDPERLLVILSRVTQPKRSRPRPAEPRRIRYLARAFPPLRGSRSAARRSLRVQLKC